METAWLTDRTFARRELPAQQNCPEISNAAEHAYQILVGNQGKGGFFWPSKPGIDPFR